MTSLIKKQLKPLVILDLALKNPTSFIKVRNIKGSWS